MLYRRFWTIAALIILAAAIGIAGCSDSDGPTDGGETDTTPPAIASVTAVDQNHVDIEFDEDLSRNSAERAERYTIVEVAPTVMAQMVESPGDTIYLNSAVLDDDERTVHLSTSNPMQNVPYMLEVTGVADKNGNAITSTATQAFTGTTNPDVTPPTVVSRSPSPGQTNVAVGTSVEVRFSEAMDYSSVVSAFSWTRTGGTVAVTVQEQDNAHFLFTPTQTLLNGTTYTVSISGAAQDWAANPLSPTSWNFTTTSQQDNVPPTLVSSTPTNGATNVSVSTNLQLTFSEPVDPTSLQEVFITPDLGSGQDSWSNGGRTVTFDPDNDLMDDTQYTLLIIPGGVRDLAGNGNTTAIQVVWSTGSSLETGGFTGTLSGPNSADVTGPGGAAVIAADRNPFGPDDDFLIGGSGVAAGNGNYSVSNLPDGTWWPLAALDSNDDGTIDPGLGDAFGLYGLDFGSMTGEPDTVVTSGTIVSGIDFSLYDIMAIFGTLSYDGSAYPGCCYDVYVGVFDTTGFDLGSIGSPNYGTVLYWPGDPVYAISEFDQGLAAGTYYVGAYLDGNSNGSLDPTDPGGFYGGTTPTPVTVANGSDGVNIDITLEDAAVIATSRWGAVARSDDARSVAFRHIVQMFRRNQR